MSRYNKLLNSFFVNCPIIGVRKDTHRNREVTIYHLSEHDGVVGFYDGVDCFITSLAQCDKELQTRNAEARSGTPFEIEFGQTRNRLNDAPGVMGYPSRVEMRVVPPRRSSRRDALPTDFFVNPILTKPGESIVTNVVRERRSAKHG